MKNADEIKIGYFKNFNDRDTVLFSCSPLGIELLKTLFQNFATNSAREIFIDELPFVHKKYKVKIKIISSNKFSSIRKINNNFIWELTKRSCEYFSNLMDGLSERRGHQYLESYQDDDLQVIVACGEYDDKWWGKNFELGLKDL